MKEPYLQAVLDRSRELSLLDQAARRLPERKVPGRWIIAAALGLFSAFFPAVSAAQTVLCIV